MSNSPQTPHVNPILIGKAEEIDLLLPAVRQMMERQGIYLASDTERPGWTVPLVVNAEGLWSMQLDTQLDPERFKDTVQIAGPFYAPGEEVERAAQSSRSASLGIDLAALRARVVSAIERITSGTGQMCVPADLTDPDLVLADVLALLDTLDPQLPSVPRPMHTAPRDGTVVRLLVQFEEHLIEDTDEPAWTIGACNDDLVQEDERIGWQVAGWCWEHDHFTEGKGTPVGWLPMLDIPKGGSEARDAALAALVEAATSVERADADGELTDDLMDRLRAARDAAQASDTEATHG